MLIRNPEEMRRSKFSLVQVNQFSPLSSPTYLTAWQSRRRRANSTPSLTFIRSFNQATRFSAPDSLTKGRSFQTKSSSTMASENFVVDDALVTKVTAYVEKYMSNYDASHDLNHIQRVLRLSLHIQSVTPDADRSLVTLAALLHDVGDKKYLRPGEDASRMISALLVSFGAPAALADTVQAICLGVSYSSEVKDPARTRALVEKYPELAVVQDADRLDAIGAVGIARTFAFGGAKGRTLENTMDHFDEKLLLLEGMMKTDEGRRMARERTERLRLLKEWWEEETAGSVGA